MDNIEVIQADLELLRSAINSAYYKSLSEDMGRAYSSLSNGTKECALTKLLGQALTKVDAYLVANEEAVDEETPDV